MAQCYTNVFGNSVYTRTSLSTIFIPKLPKKRKLPDPTVSETEGSSLAGPEFYLKKDNQIQAKNTTGTTG